MVERLSSETDEQHNRKRPENTDAMRNPTTTQNEVRRLNRQHNCSGSKINRPFFFWQAYIGNKNDGRR